MTPSAEAEDIADRWSFSPCAKSPRRIRHVKRRAGCGLMVDSGQSLRPRVGRSSQHGGAGGEYQPKAHPPRATPEGLHRVHRRQRSATPFNQSHWIVRCHERDAEKPTAREVSVILFGRARRSMRGAGATPGGETIRPAAPPSNHAPPGSSKPETRAAAWGCRDLPPAGEALQTRRAPVPPAKAGWWSAGAR